MAFKAISPSEALDYVSAYYAAVDGCKLLGLDETAREWQCDGLGGENLMRTICATVTFGDGAREEAWSVWAEMIDGRRVVMGEC